MTVKPVKVELAPEIIDAAIELARMATGQVVSPAAALEALVRAHCAEVEMLIAEGRRTRGERPH